MAIPSLPGDKFHTARWWNATTFYAEMKYGTYVSVSNGAISEHNYTRSNTDNEENRHCVLDVSTFRVKY